MVLLLMMMMVIKSASLSAGTAVIELSDIINILITQITLLSHLSVFTFVSVYLSLTLFHPYHPGTHTST